VLELGIKQQDSHCSLNEHDIYREKNVKIQGETCLENLEMSGSFTAVSKMSAILLKIREILSGKSCPKLFIVSCIFASIQVFSTSTGMIMSNTLHAECHRGVLQTVREISGNCQGISHCLKSGHPEDKQHLHVASGCELYETCKHHQLVLLIQRENSWH